MRLRAELLLIALLLHAGCASSNPVGPEHLPAWLTSLIQRLESEPVANPPAFIARYEYQGEVVYYLPPRCCDVWSTVYRVDGTILCHADGGIGGNGDGRCAAFLTERKNEQIVWRDPRGGT